MSVEQEGRKLVKRKWTRFTPETKMTALMALDRNGGNEYKTAKELGISVQILRYWVKARLEGRLVLPSPPEIPANAPLDEQLEQLVRQMIAVMPTKVEEASLQELARALTIVLDRMNQARSGNERVSHAREKLAEILEKYAVDGAAGTPEPPDGLRG